MTETAVAPTKHSRHRGTRRLPDPLEIREAEAKAIRARDRKLRQILGPRKGVQVERAFVDGAGGKHEVKSVPVPGGKFLYDDSRRWGLRALGLCAGGDGPRHLEALARDYAERCSEEKRPLCRRLEADDIRKRKSSAKAEGGA